MNVVKNTFLVFFVNLYQGVSLISFFTKLNDNKYLILKITFKAS
jgi:hypothetical protein